jgi:hypothetical protein
MEERRMFRDSAVGETSMASVAVGGVFSTVADGATLAGIVGRSVDVGSATGTSAALQAVRKSKHAVMNFFIESNYM